MKDRFDLEQDITSCWNITEDLDVILERVLDSPKFKDMPPELCDKVANLLIGLKELYDMRFERLYDTYLQAFNLEPYRKQEYTESGFRTEYAGPDT